MNESGPDVETTPANPEGRAARALVERLAAFCRRQGGRVFANFSREVLFDYLAFHLVHGSLVFVRWEEQILGVGIAWRCHEDEILAADEAQGNVFHWAADNPSGDCLMIGEVVAATPQAFLVMLNGLAARYPQAADLKLYTFRRTRLVRITRERVARIFRRFQKIK